MISVATATGHGCAGRHHTRDHWTRVWDGTQWLEDQAAVNAILSVTGDPENLIPTVACNRSRRVGVGQPRPQYESAYGCDDWLDILQGKEPGSRHGSLLQLAGFLLGKACCRRWWSRSYASSGTRPETIRPARRSMFDRLCRTSFSGIPRLPCSKARKATPSPTF